MLIRLFVNAYMDNIFIHFHQLDHQLNKLRYYLPLALIKTDVSIGANTALVYKYRESYRSQKLLSSTARRKRQTSANSRLSLRIRTGSDGVLMRTEPAEAIRTLEVTSFSLCCYFMYCISIGK